MPTASRRKAKQTKKITTLTQPNQHSSAAVQVSENHIKMEAGPFNGTLQDAYKVVEEEFLNEDNKEVVVKVEVPAAAAADDGKSSETRPDVDIAAINGEQVESDKVEETEDVSESVADSLLDPCLNYVSSPNEDTVVLEVKEEKGEDFLSFEDTTEGFSPVLANHGVVVEETELPPSEDNNDHLSSSVSGNEVLRETEAVVTEEEKDDVLSSVVTEEPNPNEINAASSSLPSTDVVSREVVVETKSDAKSDESEEVPPKEIEKSTYEKVEEQSDVQESSSNRSAKECFQPSQNIADAESNSATDQQDKTEEPRSFENPIIVPVTQRQHTSWKSCCGLFEILRHGDR